MAYCIEGITRVRAGPLALDVAEATPLAAPGEVEVTWESVHAGRWHQVYVGRVLAGVTARPDDRRLIVAAPIGGAGVSGPVLVEVVAVDAADRARDLSEELTGFAEAQGSRVRLVWQAGPHLDARLESFDIFADAGTGTVDYARPLNEAPVPARPDGAEPWGYGCGGFGMGGYGAGAALYEWTTDSLEPGPWKFAVVAADAAGNRLATAAEVTVQVAPLPRPPENFRMAQYDETGRTALLAWDASPDL